MGLIWFLGYIQYQESFPQQMPNSCLQYCFSFSPPLLFCIIDHLAAPPPPPRRQEAEGRPSGCRSITGAGLQQRRRRPCPKILHDQVELVGLCLLLLLLLLLLHTIEPCSFSAPQTQLAQLSSQQRRALEHEIARPTFLKSFNCESHVLKIEPWLHWTFEIESLTDMKWQLGFFSRRMRCRERERSKSGLRHQGLSGTKGGILTFFGLVAYNSKYFSSRLLQRKRKVWW